jgi:cell division inhibitor SepF
MRKMAAYLGLVEDQDFVDDYDEPEVQPRAREPRPAPERKPERPRPQEPSSVRVSEARPSGVRTIRDPRSESYETSQYERNVEAKTPMSVGDLKISTIHPRSYNDARRIGEEFRSGTPVIMNLTEMEDGDAKRIVDFSAGLVFGLHGTIERITNKVFLLSPANVDVAAEARAQLAQDGFFNQS